MKLVVALSGASGVEYGIDLLQALKDADVETHLIVSEWADKVILIETNYRLDDVKKLATVVYDPNDQAAALASSSFLVDGMVIIPATVKTIGAIASSYSDNLVSRAADNMLKTRRPLVLCLRETPLSTPVLKNLYELSVSGAIIFPLSPGFYHEPKSIEDLRTFISGKILDLLGIQNELYKRWTG